MKREHKSHADSALLHSCRRQITTSVWRVERFREMDLKSSVLLFPYRSQRIATDVRASRLCMGLLSCSDRRYDDRRYDDRRYDDRRYDDRRYDSHRYDGRRYDDRRGRYDDHRDAHHDRSRDRREDSRDDYRSGYNYQRYNRYGYPPQQEYMGSNYPPYHQGYDSYPRRPTPSNPTTTRRTRPSKRAPSLKQAMTPPITRPAAIPLFVNKQSNPNHSPVLSQESSQVVCAKKRAHSAETAIPVTPTRWR